MNVKQVKKTPNRIDVSYLRNLEIQSYGEDNLYPQTIAKLLAASPTGGECAERYKTFIEGNGFREVKFSEYVVNKAGETADDILHLLCEDVGDNDGVAIHVNYNMLCEIVEMSHVPFENCRLYEEDDRGFVSKIAVHPDWSGKKTRSGKVLKINKETVDYIDVYNPNKTVVQSQIEAAGGIDNYKGQILWISLKGKNVYPVSICDKVATELSTDEGISNVKYRNVRCNFLMAGMIVTRKGQSVPVLDESGKEVKDEIEEDTEFSDNLVKLQGDVNANKLMEVTINENEEIPQLVKFTSNNYDKEFTVTESSTVERIYCAYNQEPWYCIRIGKVGFGGDVMEDAFEIYNSFVSKKQRAIERAFKKIFLNWHEEIPNLSMDFSIQPLKYVRNASKSDNNE